MSSHGVSYRESRLKSFSRLLKIAFSFPSDQRSTFYRLVKIQVQQNVPLDQISDGMAEAKGLGDGITRVGKACVRSMSEGGLFADGLFLSGLVPSTEAELIRAAENRDTESLIMALDQSGEQQGIKGFSKDVLFKNLYFGGFFFVIIVALANAESLANKLIDLSSSAADQDIIKLIFWLSEYGAATTALTFIFCSVVIYIRLQVFGPWRKAILFLNEDYRRIVAIKFSQIAALCSAQHIPDDVYVDIARNSISGGYAKTALGRVKRSLNDSEDINTSIRGVVFDEATSELFNQMTKKRDLDAYPAAYKTVGLILEERNSAFYKRALGFLKMATLVAILYCITMLLIGLLDTFAGFI